MKTQLTLGEIAVLIKAEVIGDASLRVSNIRDLSEADAETISFISNPKYTPQLKTTRAAAVIAGEDLASLSPVAVLVVADPYLAYALVAQLFDTTPTAKVGITHSAVIDERASLGKNVAIGEKVIIEKNVVIADNVQIFAGCVIAEGCSIGEGSILKANVVLYHDVQLGSKVLVHSGTIIGADGFGFANQAGKWVKIPQLGKVIIGDDVEIGANCTIDRGALKNTQIGNGVKLDNMIHIAHNVIIGEHCAMAAFVGIAGSSTIGDRSTLAGGAGVLGHIDIPAGTHLTARTLVNKSPKQAGIFSSGTGMLENRDWRKSVARFKQLDEMSRNIRQLQKQLKKLS